MLIAHYSSREFGFRFVETGSSTAIDAVNLQVKTLVMRHQNGMTAGGWSSNLQQEQKGEAGV